MTHDSTPQVVESLRETPDEDGLFEPVRNVRRRTVVRYLDRLPSGATVEVRELARVCAAVETDVAYGDVPNSAYRRAYQGLKQRDVTRLALAGVVENGDGGLSRGVQFDRYAALLRCVDATL